MSDAPDSYYKQPLLDRLAEYCCSDIDEAISHINKLEGRTCSKCKHYVRDIHVTNHVYLYCDNFSVTDMVSCEDGFGNLMPPPNFGCTLWEGK